MLQACGHIKHVVVLVVLRNQHTLNALRTITSANQLSIHGSVSCWCDDLAEKMHGQTSLGVDKSVSEESGWLTGRLGPLGVGSLVQIL